uniref:PA domain-containing protein n=1 Tax=Castor canadensis TaxID=51338 RepID=A0A8C0XWS0_CASCN
MTSPICWVLWTLYLMGSLIASLSLLQVTCEYGMVHDYCILYNPQWAHLPQDLSKASLLQLSDWTSSLLCSPGDLPASGFSDQIPLVARGKCTFYEKARLAQGSGARGLLIVSTEKLSQGHAGHLQGRLPPHCAGPVCPERAVGRSLWDQEW